MSVAKKRISTLVDNQLPEFISTEYPKFSAFIQKYYEHLELTGQSLDIINNLSNYADIDTYEKKILSEYTHITSNVLDSDTVIFVEDTYAFPEKNGYVMIDDEVIFYAEKTANSFIGCVRNVSGTTKLGDLYNTSTYKVGNYGNGVNHLSGAQIYNISNLFLYAFVKNYETQYLASFPEESLKKEIDKRTLIKNIKQFYRSKGTEQSIKFIFNSLITQDGLDIPEIYYPKDNTLKSSTSDWINKLSLRVKVISGDPFKVIGEKLYQEEDVYNSSVKNAFAIIDNVNFLGNFDGESIYEVILAPETVVGEFSVAQKTFLTKRLLPSSSTDNRINVFSTSGWKNVKGKIRIGSETFTFKDKNVNQFVIDSRSGGNSAISGDYPKNTQVLNYSNLSAKYVEDGIEKNVSFLCYGVLYGVSVSSGQPYSTEGDEIQISDSGFETRNPVIYNKLSSSVRWLLNSDTTGSNISGLEEVLTDISAIYEDDQYYYIASSGLPSYNIGNFVTLTPSDQKNLKLIRKEAIRNTELYPTPTRDIGIFLNGVLAYGYKDYDSQDVIFGGVETINVTNKGKGYKNPPYVLIEGDKEAKARAILSGEVLERIEVINPGEKFERNPSVTITSGRGAQVSATVTKDKVTKLTIVNPGEYYSTPPLIFIKDRTNNGRLAEYTSIISTDGKLIGFNKISEGKFYTQENISVEVIPIGRDATASAFVKRWKNNRYDRLKNRIGIPKLDNNNGYLFENIEKSFGYGYAHVANPVALRNLLLDNDASKHSPILGYAYDGNPIYGPYAYENPLNPNSSISRMTSSYRLKTSRDGGPNLSDYPLGSFTEDYRYQHRFGSLDENNGRYCVTPDYPNGTYAYFVTVDSTNTPVFPYIIGERFYSIPVESNYVAKINQNNIPSKSRRLKTQDTPANGINANVIVESTTEGNITLCTVEDSPSNFSIGNKLYINNDQTSGFGLIAEVSKLKGKNILSIESKETKAAKIVSKKPVYFFNQSIITQEGTNASGEVVGNIFSADTFVLRNISGNFDTINKLNSSVRVLNLIVDTESFYTKDAFVRLTSGKEVVILSITTNTLRVAFNPFTNGDGISFARSSNGIIENKIYYVINASSSNFQISETQNGSPVSLINSSSFGVVATSEIARGTILEQVISGNTLKVKVDDGNFITSRDFYLKSEIIDDTIGSRIFQIDELSKNIEIFSINNNISLVTTDEDHNLTLNDKVTIDIIPDDTETTTNYYVRKRIYQTIKLFPPVINTAVSDTGIGTVKRLNSGEDYANAGSATFTNVELIFSDQTKTRDENGLLTTPEKSHVGGPGAPGNAKATITVSNGRVSENGVVITTKGSGYQIGDILTVSNTSLNRLSGSLSQSYLFLEVTHVGFGKNNTILRVSDIRNFSSGDVIKINQENIRVDSVSNINKTLTVTRSFNNTIRENHFNGDAISFVTAKYLFNEGDTLGGSSNSPIVKSYDEITQELTVYFDINQTLESISPLSFNSSFFDSGSPSKLVSVDSVVAQPSYKFEFSKYNESGPWLINPIIPIQKYYRYNFITKHPSLAGSFLEFSPSINKNILTTESIRGNALPGSGDDTSSYISVKFGFGDASPSNNYDVKESVDFRNYYYFDKAAIVDSSNSYLLLQDDPLQGEKTVTYVSPRSFAYEMNFTPEYDGHGVFSYSTNSIFAEGQIESVSIVNTGKLYKKIPTVHGVLPNSNNLCEAEISYDEKNTVIESISILKPGKNYSKPKVILETDNDLLLLNFDVTVGNSGEIIAIKLLNPDRKFNKKPEIYVIESDVKIFFGSKNVGYPKNLKVIYNGSNYYNDTTLSSVFTSHQILTIKNFDENSFVNGEIIKQFENGFLIAEGRIAKDGFDSKRNFLKVEKVKGEFRKNLIISGNLKRKTALVTDNFVTLFNPDIKSYYDNTGYYDTAKGQLSSSNQRLSDSYFYQDYSYVVKSKTPINIWRKLVEQTVHPSGFKMFGEVNIDAEAKTSMPSRQNVTSSVSIIELWDETTNRVTIENTRQQITQTIVRYKDTNIRRGKGSVLVSGIDTTELLSYVFELQQPFDGDFDESGNIVGRRTFNMILPGFGVLNVFNPNNLFVTIDGVMQNPGTTFTVSGSTITFATPPLGQRISNNQIIEPQKFVGRMIRFKNNDFNSRYFKKIKNIDNDFNGIETRFPLFYEDGTDVVLDAKENLLVSLDGVVQENKMTPLIPATSSYYIDRTVTPNHIVFIDAPRKLDDVNRSKFFAYSIGNYERLEIDPELFDSQTKGPFLLRRVLDRRTVTVDNDRTVLVFVEGVLQIRNRAYTITGSDIFFAEPPKPGQIINIIYLYGKESTPKLTFYNFENNKFFNKVDIISSAFISNDQLQKYDTVYQGTSIKDWDSIGEVLTSFASTDSQGNPTIRIIIKQQNYKFSPSQPLKLSSYKSPVQEFIIYPEDIVSITDYEKDDEQNELVFKTKSGWMYGTELSPVYSNNLDVGDLIQVDGERDYRSILLIPEVLKKLGHRRDDLIENNHYGQIGVTTYNGIVDGVGLSVFASVSNGEISSLTWNRRKYERYASIIDSGIIVPKTVFTRNSIIELSDQTIVELRNGINLKIINKTASVVAIKKADIQPSAFGYRETPDLVFVPQPLRDTYGNIIGPVSGGGASGFVVMNGGEIIDVVLTNKGSGYVTPPKVYVTRGYNVYKSPQKVINSSTDLVLSPKITLDTALYTQITITIDGKLTPNIETVIDVQSSYDSTNPTIIITPPEYDVTCTENQKQITSILNLEAAQIDSITNISYQRISEFYFDPIVTTIDYIIRNTTLRYDFGFVDVYDGIQNQAKYNYGKLGNRFEVYENIKFMTDYGVADVSEQNTLEMMELHYPNITIGDFSDRHSSSVGQNGAIWDITWPSIQEHGALLDSSLSSLDDIVYIPDTSRFPSSGKLLIGNEIITYTDKLSDRFIGCVRGAENTVVQTHNPGDYLRSLS